MVWPQGRTVLPKPRFETLLPGRRLPATLMFLVLGERPSERVCPDPGQARFPHLCPLPGSPPVKQSGRKPVCVPVLAPQAVFSPTEPRD